MFWVKSDAEILRFHGFWYFKRAVPGCFFAPKVVQNGARVVRYDAKLLQKDAKLTFFLERGYIEND